MECSVCVESFSKKRTKIHMEDMIKAVDTLIDTNVKIRDYCNEQLVNVSKNYKMKLYQIPHPNSV